MTNESQPDDPTRRQWILRLGEMVALIGVSGILPESAAHLFAQETAQEINAAALPPGLYDPSQDHLVHALARAGKNWTPPPGSETDYASPDTLPYRPQFFSAEEFRTITRFIEILLGNVEPQAIAQAAQWFDLWLHASAGVRAAAHHLDPLHHALAVAYYGESEVRDLETADPQSAARAGLAALQFLSTQKHHRDFLQLTAAEQLDLLTGIANTSPDTPLRKFFDLTRTQTIRAYYTSRQGLEELDYQGNAFHPESPGCNPKP